MILTQPCRTLPSNPYASSITTVDFIAAKSCSYFTRGDCGRENSWVPGRWLSAAGWKPAVRNTPATSAVSIPVTSLLIDQTNRLKFLTKDMKRHANRLIFLTNDMKFHSNRLIGQTNALKFLSFCMNRHANRVNFLT